MSIQIGVDSVTTQHLLCDHSVNTIELGSYTRRGALVAILTGSAWLAIDTDAFTSVEANQSPEVDAAPDDNALLGINTSQVRAPPHKIELTNNTQSSFTITIESKNNKFTFSRSTVENLSPGDTATISISTDQTGRVSEEIVIKCDFAQKSGAIDISRQITIDVPEEDEDDEDEDDEDGDDEDDEDEDDEDEDDEDGDDEDGDDEDDEDDEDEDDDDEDEDDDDDDEDEDDDDDDEDGDDDDDDEDGDDEDGD